MTTSSRERDATKEVLMPKFRKKPVVIEAMLFDGSNIDEIEAFVGSLLYGEALHEVFIKTLEGAMQISVGDWVIRGVQGEFYPCKDAIMRATYQPVDDAGEAIEWGQ